MKAFVHVCLYPCPCSYSPLSPPPPSFPDMTQLLWELELTIQKVNVSTSPGGQAIDFFFITDNR